MTDSQKPPRQRTPKPNATLIVYSGKFRRRNQKWRWQLVAENGNILAVSSEGYANEEVAYATGKRVCSGGYKVTLGY